MTSAYKYALGKQNKVFQGDKVRGGKVLASLTEVCEELDKTFPLRPLRPGMDPSTAYFNAGQRDVIDKLKEMIERSVET